MNYLLGEETLLTNWMQTGLCIDLTDYFMQALSARVAFQLSRSVN